MSKSIKEPSTFAKCAMRKSLKDVIKKGKHPLTGKKLKKSQLEHLKNLLKGIK